MIRESSKGKIKQNSPGRSGLLPHRQWRCGTKSGGREDIVSTGEKVSLQKITLIGIFPKTDENGNKTLAGTNRNYVWDHADRMMAYYNQAGSSEPSVYAMYFYDASGQRVKKMVRTSGGTIDTIVYIDDIFEYRTDGTNTNSITYVMDASSGSTLASRMARVRVGNNFGDTAAATLYIMEDHLSSSTIRLTNTGTVADREEYYPFGDSSLRTWTRKRYRYTGKEKDEESGLYYYGARLRRDREQASLWRSGSQTRPSPAFWRGYYAAWVGRWISTDPLGMVDGPNLYAYVLNNPVKLNDGTGMQVDQKEEAQSQSNTPNNTTEKLETIIHVVQKGDTMSELAAAYGSSVKDIGSANPQTHERKQEHQINVGEELKIPITKQADNLESAPNTLDVLEVKPTEQGDLEAQVKHQIESGEPIDVDSKDAFKQVL